MFERFRKEAPELQLYGKLPLAKDYLRVGASQGAGRDLREWLDHAFSSRAVHGDAPSFAWPARFILGAVEGDPLMGSAWPSSDSGNERSFPFAVFVERRRKALAAAFHAGLAGLCRVWDPLTECHASQAEFPDGQSFLARMRGRTIPIDPEASSRTPRAHIGWEAWTNALWQANGQEGLIELLISLARLGADGHGGPLRLPLVANLPSAPQVHGWWSALVSLELAGANDLPTVFYPAPEVAHGAPAFATFFARTLRVEDAAWIRVPREEGQLGKGDHALPQPALADPRAPVPEGAPDLATSMRGALATARARA